MFVAAKDCSVTKFGQKHALKSLNIISEKPRNEVIVKLLNLASKPKNLNVYM